MVLAASLSGSALLANEFIYNAEVTDQKEISSYVLTNEKSATCYQASPDEFSTLLAWDIGCEKPRKVEVTRYEVTYRIGGSVFTTIVDEQVGDYFPVRLNLNLASR